jgi:hypothetical protein
MKESEISGRGVDGMGKTNLLFSPKSLEEGKSYLLRSRNFTKNGGSILILSQVIFIGFTSCPAIVVVQDARTEWLRCSRDDLSKFNQGT